MDAKVRRKLEMGARVLEHGQAHPLESPGYATTLAQIESKLVRADQLAGQQRDGILEVRATTQRKRDLMVRIRRAHLTHLTQVARVAAHEVPELPQKFVFKPGKGSYAAFRTAARGMQVEAQARRELLVRHGLVEPLLDDLGRLLDEFDHALERGREARRIHVGASAELRVVADDLVRLVSALSGVNRYRFANDPEQLAVWEYASSVLAARRPSPEPPAGDSGVRPAA